MPALVNMAKSLVGELVDPKPESTIIILLNACTITKH